MEHVEVTVVTVVTVEHVATAVDPPTVNLCNQGMPMTFGTLDLHLAKVVSTLTWLADGVD